MRQKREADPNVGLAGESGRRSGAMIECGSGEMRLVVGTPDLPTLQRHATDLGLERGLKARITRMQRSKA